MGNFLITALLAVGIFALCIGAMAVGLAIRGRIMRGGCGSDTVVVDGVERCGACGSDRGERCRRGAQADASDPSEHDRDDA